MKRFVQLFLVLIFLSFQDIWASDTYTITSTADNGPESLRDFIDNKVNDGDILIVTGSIQLSESIILKNSITIQGETDDVTITAATGSRVFTVESGKKIRIEKVKLVGNSATSESVLPNHGGVILLQEAEAAFKHIAFVDGAVIGGNGGAIYSAKSKLSLEGNTFTGNSATKYGGAVYAEGEDTEMSFQGDQFFNNTGDEGAAVYIEEFTTIGKVIFNDCKFQKNNGGLCGGVISGVSTEIKSCRFEGNTATRSIGALALWGQNNKSTVDGSLFTGNSGMRGGAVGVYYGASLDITNEEEVSTVFTENVATADVGGAIYLDGAQFLATAKLTDVIFGEEGKGNKAAKNGGAIANNKSILIMNGGSIVGNEAPAGSAISSAGSVSTMKLTNVSVQNNISDEAGGTIFNNGMTSCELTNVLLAGNQCDDSGVGGGLRNVKTNTILTNVTIADNKAGTNGGGIYNQNSTMKIRNSVIWGNTLTGGSPSNVINVIGGSIEYSYSLVEGESLVGEGNISSSIDPFNKTGSTRPYYSLLEGSTLVDGGNNDYVETIITDLVGNTRIYNKANEGKVDIGAYELIFNSLVYHANYDADQTKNIAYPEGDQVLASTYDATGLSGRSGYTFVYWSSEPDGSGTRYEPGSLFDIPGTEYHLYAQWQIKITPPLPPVPENPDPENPDPNPDPSGNADINTNTYIWSGVGAVYIHTEQINQKVYIMDYNGKIYTQQKLSLGETAIQLRAGHYIVVLSDGTIQKIAVRNF